MPVVKSFSARMALDFANRTNRHPYRASVCNDTRRYALGGNDSGPNTQPDSKSRFFMWTARERAVGRLFRVYPDRFGGSRAVFLDWLYFLLREGFYPRPSRDERNPENGQILLLVHRSVDASFDLTWADVCRLTVALAQLSVLANFPKPVRHRQRMRACPRWWRPDMGIGLPFER